MMNLQLRRLPNGLKWLVPCAVTLLVSSPAAQADLLRSTNPVEFGSAFPCPDCSKDESACEVGCKCDCADCSKTVAPGATSGSGKGIVGSRRAKFAFGSVTAGVLAGSGLLLSLGSGGGSATLAKSGGTVGVDPPVAPVPEPGTISLMVIGLTGLMGVARRRKAAGDDQK